MQIAWKNVPLRHFFPLNVVPLIEILLYLDEGLGPECETVLHVGDGSLQHPSQQRDRLPSPI
jgi:hypothetical protein